MSIKNNIREKFKSSAINIHYIGKTWQALFEILRNETVKDKLVK